MTNPNDLAFALLQDMTKRELFAAMAMQGLLSNIFAIETGEKSARQNANRFERMLSRRSVCHADALIAELNKPEIKNK